MPSCAGFHQLYAYYSANQYYNADFVELDQNIQSADTTTTLIVNNSTTVAGQAVTFTGARQHSSTCMRSRMCRMVFSGTSACAATWGLLVLVGACLGVLHSPAETPHHGMGSPSLTRKQDA
jgi:hypothetical protein